MSVEVIAKLKPKNGGEFSIVDAHDIAVDDSDKRLDELIKEVKETTISFSDDSDGNVKIDIGGKNGGTVSGEGNVNIKSRKKQKIRTFVKKFTKVWKKCRVRGGGGQKSTPFHPYNGAAVLREKSQNQKLLY